MADKEYLTQEKHNELKKEFDFLTRIKRREVAEKLEYAKSLGDLSENAEYQEAREAQALLEERIARLETVLARAEIIAPHHRGDTVRVGSVVVVKKGKSDERTYTLVGSEEANMAEGKISDQSPIGAAMMGKKGGDRFKVMTPGGELEYTIVAVS